MAALATKPNAGPRVVPLVFLAGTAWILGSALQRTAP
jgi:hypothetical protein